MRRRLATAIVGAAMCLHSGTAVAQSGGTPPSSVLLNGRDLALLGIATASSVALVTLDTRIANFMTDSGFQARHPGFKTAAYRASHVTETVLILTGGAVWGMARLNDDRGTADVAFHTTEAVFSTAMVIQVVRGALGRGRPYVVDDENGEKRNGDPREFKFLRGFTSYNYRSWPSMHAMANFAVASALSQEMRVRDTPHRQVLAPALYAAAVMPSLARMYLDEQEALRQSHAAGWTAEDGLDTGDEANFLRPGLSRQVLRKLRSGTWVIQRQLDLHGLDRHQAREALADFLASCVKRGVRCVRVIHGKGLGSKGREPVLKTKVKHWLTQRGEVLAYCQARPVDGGSGALVVLLKG